MRVLITGGAGFIGSNLAAALARGGHSVLLADNLARPGSAVNLRSLLEDAALAPHISYVQLDVRDRVACMALLDRDPADAVVHLAGQVAVTTSIADPAEDFETNACGTLNMLEAVRVSAPTARFLFASTNKVYGSLDGLRVERARTRYILRDFSNGIPETFSTDAATPYGCSKLAGDAYVREYARTYGLAATVLRLSCVYGTRQNGTTDQGWVSWFVRAALQDRALTIYGDGLQVRDVLHVDDLVELVMILLTERSGGGETFNVGGGTGCSVSIWTEFGALLESLLGRRIAVRYSPRRLADQRVYISDIGRVTERTGWSPRTTLREGISELIEWTRAESADPTRTVTASGVGR